jgi:hypothetical protein
MKILKSEKEKLIKWVNGGASTYTLHNYLVNICGYSQIDSKKIIDNIDNIDIFDSENVEYRLDNDGNYWYVEKYTNNELVFAVMGNSVPDCYRQMFKTA